MKIPTTRYARYRFYRQRASRRMYRLRSKRRRSLNGKEPHYGPNERDISGLEKQAAKKYPHVVGWAGEPFREFNYELRAPGPENRNPVNRVTSPWWPGSPQQKRKVEMLGAVRRRLRHVPHLRKLARRWGPIVPRPKQRFEDRPAT